MPKPISALSTSMPIASVNCPLPSGIKLMLSASWCSAHAFITKVSLTDIQIISSTPFLNSVGANSLYRGKCEDEQVGVKAPGNEKTTTVLSLKISSLVRVVHSSFALNVNVTLGTFCCSLFSNIMAPFIVYKIVVLFDMHLLSNMAVY